MKKLSKKYLVVAFLILIIPLIIFATNNYSQKPEVKISPKSLQEEQEAEPRLELEESSITLYSEDGITRWELGAESIQQFELGNQITLNQIQAKVYEEEKEVINIIADKGKVDIETGFIGLEGPITIKSQEKLLKADNLNWNSAKNELIGLGHVLIEQPGLKVRGERFISQVDLKKLEILGNVKVISQEMGEGNEE
ncbi:LPS export ABC transporter protein LptC [Orenia metallireducens]|uniref:LPS export ABC transporter protein LptC n=1 Tax=Orenia metallireducens TaxID=1413210 RepID=A0A285GME2_9FIRM|nr:LPS export ABC transporter periplasmic protein LptC [Orenia metallireducens]PRX35715.1 LPS export ABC transporter protein LptC [Orenia metallireducens]SNY24374.1 LPS export ABC transporter protein LptC [Orenia metallireducens]